MKEALVVKKEIKEKERSRMENFMFSSFLFSILQDSQKIRVFIWILLFNSTNLYSKKREVFLW